MSHKQKSGRILNNFVFLSLLIEILLLAYAHLSLHSMCNVLSIQKMVSIAAGGLKAIWRDSPSYIVGYVPRIISCLAGHVLQNNSLFCGTL